MMSQQQRSSKKVQSEVIDLTKLLGILMDAKWLILIVTTVFSFCGIAYALLAAPVYRADALIQVEEKTAGVPGLSDISEMFATESSSDTEIQIIKSRMIIGATVDNLNLSVTSTPAYFPIIGKPLSRLIDRRHPSVTIKKLELPSSLIDKKLVLTIQENHQFELEYAGDLLLSGDLNQSNENGSINFEVSQVDALPGDKFYIVKTARLVTINDLQQALSIAEQGKKTGILRLSLEGEEPQKIQAILDSIAHDYLMQNVERTSAEAEKSLQFLRSHLPEIKSTLDSAETKLNEYKLQNDSVDLKLEAESVLKTMVTIESRLNELQFQESEISQRYTKSHPAYLSLMEKRKALLTEKNRLDGLVAKMPKTQQEVIRLSRDVEVNQAIYLQLVAKVQELSVMKASAIGNVRILDNAETLEEPVKPKKPIIIIVSTIMGMLLSIGFAVMRHALHKGVENPDEIEEIGLPVYASIPRSELQAKFDLTPKNRKKTQQGLLLAETNPADLSIESLRSLRTSLHFAMMEAKNNVLMISGPAPGIGKSFVSANFAAVTANTGQRVLLIDADMRKGYLQKYFNMRWEHGLSDYLSGKAPIEDIIKTSQIEGLSVITRGQIPPNPSELLMHPRFIQFIDWASSNFDLVIIDTPPILAVTDASIIGAHSGTTLMVGRFGKNSVKEIEVARNRFEQAGIEVKGFILNAVEKKASSAYGYYNYSYADS
ncbi:polysaccharide biosynthesis tyrosine autokinase [Vibrio cholerae]|nr:polysaccharide biosynthesis tyrosine autokinase [Vibrio cholerae]